MRLASLCFAAACPLAGYDGRARGRRTRPLAPEPQARTPADTTALPVDTIPRASASPSPGAPSEPLARTACPLSLPRPMLRPPLRPLHTSGASNPAHPVVVTNSEEPQRKSSSDVTVSRTGPKQASTSELAARSSSPGSIRGTEKPTCGLATPVRPGDRPCRGDRIAPGIHLPTALLSSVPGYPSDGPVWLPAPPAGRNPMGRSPSLMRYGFFCDGRRHAPPAARTGDKPHPSRAPSARATQPPRAHFPRQPRPTPREPQRTRYRSSSRSHRAAPRASTPPCTPHAPRAHA